MPAEFELSIIIPALNEARRLPRSLEAIRAFARGYPGRIELIVVDDGSNDETAQIPQVFETDELRVKVLINPTNRGKGFSVKRGMLEANGELLLMTDADLSTPIEEIVKLRQAIDSGCDVAIGSREMPDSRLEPPQPVYRRFMGGVFAAMRSLLLVKGFVDSQCGFKLFTRSAGKAIFEKLVTEGYAFDCEILARAVRMNLRVKEVGVVWKNDLDSRIRPIRDSARMFFSLWQIRRQLRGEAVPSPDSTSRSNTSAH
jgi:dolichyl-phosphate beta-glucosyltransferase